jgi:phenylacetic acid degradation operon negative regulatory protein
MSLTSECDRLIDEFRSRPTVRAGSLITTVFGDAIAPRGGVVWLGSLIRALADFGISERLVRTSVYRLARDGWLQSRQVGRRSFYSLTETGRERFAQATHRIYGDPARIWDGEWCLLLLGGLETAQREQVRKEAAWLGFASMSANLLAHPTPDMAELDLALGRLGLAGDVVVMQGRPTRAEGALRRLARHGWSLDELDARYAGFVEQFRPSLVALKAAVEAEPRTAFLLRTLLIQEYRRILLRDPHLPAELLPPQWHGRAAYQLCRNLYLGLYEPAEAYIGEWMENAEGPLPPPSRDTFTRFGGIEALA